MRRKGLIFGFIGFLFAFCTIVCRDLAAEGNLLWTAGYIARVLAWSAVFGGFVGAEFLFAGRLAGKWTAARRREKAGAAAETMLGTAAETAPGNGPRPWQFWLCSAALIALCWLPCYLAYYPGICAYDATIQTGQIADHSYNDHHPIAHTLLIEGSMRLGEKLFGNVNTGIGMLTLAQMLVLACAFAWGIALLYSRGARLGWLVCLQAFCMFYPFHMYMSVSMIKDVLFSVFFLIQMLSLCEITGRGSRRFGVFDALFGLSSVGMQLFRSNGRYAMLVLQVFLLAAFLVGKRSRRFWGKAAVECMLALAVGSVLLSALFRLTDAEQGDRREMLSMPIQQLARCMLYHGGVGVLAEDDGTMSEEDKGLVNDFLLGEGYREYRPDLADPVKSHTNTYVVRYRTGDFIRTYLNLLRRYPGDFVNAALAVNAGYLYIGDESHAAVNQNGRERGLGYVQTRWVENELNPRGIYKDSKWEGLHEKLEQWADGNAYLRIPILKYLFVPGTVLWLYLILFGSLAARRQYGRCMPLALALGYYLTLFLGPTVQLRYLYPLMVALPFAAVLMNIKVMYEDSERQ